jgi:hypothetical protein
VAWAGCDLSAIRYCHCHGQLLGVAGPGSLRRTPKDSGLPVGEACLMSVASRGTVQAIGPSGELHVPLVGILRFPSKIHVIRVIRVRAVLTARDASKDDSKTSCVSGGRREMRPRTATRDASRRAIRDASRRRPRDLSTADPHTWPALRNVPRDQRPTPPRAPEPDHPRSSPEFEKPPSSSAVNCVTT